VIRALLIQEREGPDEGAGGEKGDGLVHRCACIANAPRCRLLLQFANSRQNGNAINSDTITRVPFWQLRDERAVGMKRRRELK